MFWSLIFGSDYYEPSKEEKELENLLKKCNYYRDKKDKTPEDWREYELLIRRLQSLSLRRRIKE